MTIHAGTDQPRTLSIDIGGSGVKAAVLDHTGKIVGEKVRIQTPDPCPPDTLLDILVALVAPLGSFDRVSVGFPGAVRGGVVLTAPNLHSLSWSRFPLTDALARRLGKPVRMLNDAEVQGLGLIQGRGLEFVLTLGTGAGTAVFNDGRLAPHLELGQHPFRNDETYDQQIGDAALRKLGAVAWNDRVRRAIDTLRVLLSFDVMYIGGGNSVHVVEPPTDVIIASNEAGLTGGIELWTRAYGD